MYRTVVYRFGAKDLELCFQLQAEESMVKFPHSPILHYAFSSWIKKAMALSLGKQICFTIEWGCAEILPQWFAYEPSLLQVYVRKHVFLLSI